MKVQSILLLTCLSAVVAAPAAFGWGHGHDTVARETVRTLPGVWGDRLRAGEGGKLLVRYCHAPDDMKTRLDARAEFLDGELRSRLANGNGKPTVMYRFHKADARCELVRAMARAIRANDERRLGVLLACFNHSVADTVSANHSPLMQLLCYNWKPFGLPPDFADDCSVLDKTPEGRAILKRTCDALPLALGDASPDAVFAAAYADEMRGLDYFRCDLDFAAGGTPALEAFAHEAAYAVRRTAEALLAAEQWAALPEIPAFDAAAAETRAGTAAHAFLAARPLSDDAITRGLVPAAGSVPEIGVVYDPTGYWTGGIVATGYRVLAVQIATTLKKTRDAGLLDIREVMAKGVPAGVRTVVMPGGGFRDHHGFRAADAARALDAFLKRGCRLVWIGDAPPVSLFPEAKAFAKNPLRSRYAQITGPVTADDMPGGALVLPGGAKFVCRRAPKGKAGWYWQQFDFGRLLPEPLPQGATDALDFVAKDGRTFHVGYTVGSRTFLAAFALYPYVFTEEGPSVSPLRMELDAAGAAVIASALGLAAPVPSSARDLPGAYSTVRIDGAGRVVSIRENRSGRELLADASPLVQVRFADGQTLAPSKLVWTDEAHGSVRFDGRTGSVELTVEPFYGGWTFRIAAVTLPDARAVRLFALRPVCGDYVGTLANMLSDDLSGVCVRGYRMDVSFRCAAGDLGVEYESPHPFAGAAAGLVAGPRGDLPAMLRGMTAAAGVAQSRAGGAWALGAEENRSSYLFADAAATDTIDDLISIAERAGVGTIHFRSWWDQFGWYAVNTNKFPKGLADLRDCSLKAQAAGFRTTMHTLTGCVGPTAPWLRGPEAADLVVRRSYTLAEPIPAAGEVSEIVVSEKPASDHGFDFATWGSGNTLRIDGEIFQYGDISFEKPYRFLKVRRARFGTAGAAHAAGARADYLWHYFASFLVRPGTPLVDALAERILRVYRAGCFSGIYFDGADAYGVWPADGARMLEDLYAKCCASGCAPQYEDAWWTTSAWWHHSRIGSWDYARWSPKAFTDRHIRVCSRRARKSELLEMTLGWWPVVVGDAGTFGYLRDDVEYFGAKLAGHDASFSLLPSYVRGRQLSCAKNEQLTRLGWYERLRRAKAFRPDLLRKFREVGRDFRLGQEADGAWSVRETSVADHRMTSPDDRAWTVASAAARPAALRVRALDGADSWEKGGTILSAADVSALDVKAAAGAKAAVATGTGEHGATLRLTVANSSAPANGAWGCADKVWPRPYLDLNKACGKGGPLAVGTWVKGDGSGATVNFRLRTLAAFNGAISEHYVKLDFSGWRYFAFSIWREHDAGASEAFDWPYLKADGPNYAVYERALTPSKVENTGIWMNGVRPGASATVEIAELRVMPTRVSKLSGARVSLGAASHAVPFDLGSGEYAELEDGAWTRYSLQGEPLARVAASVRPTLAAGENRVGFACEDPEARAWVTVTGLGEPVPALADERTSAMRRAMAYEAELPQFFAPARGLGTLKPVTVRPGEKARLSFTLVGPIVRPTVTVGGKVWRAEKSLGANDAVSAELDGTFAGSVPVALRTDDPSKAAAQLLVVKRYECAD